MSEPRSLLRSAGSISIATFVSRILGLVREQVQSYFFGAGPATDAFLAAFRIPNLLRDLFAEGALSSAFVPTFTAVRASGGEDAARRLANRVVTALAVVLGVVSLVILAGTPWILALYAPGFDPEKGRLAVVMTRILSPFLLFVALAAVAMGILNAHGSFFRPALAPAWFNVCAIVGIVALAPALSLAGLNPALSLAIGACVGGAVQFLAQVPDLRRRGFRFAWDWAPSDPALRGIAALMLPAAFGQAATQINILVDTVLASTLGDGPISWLAYAFRLIQLPIGLFGVALATVNLTRVSRTVAAGDLAATRASLGGALRAAAFLTLPATAGLVALREPIIRLLFEHGRFGPQDTERTAAALLCYALGLYAYAATKIQVPTFYALGDSRVPVAASATAVALKIAANIALLVVLPAVGVDPFLALALTTSLAAWTNFAILGWGLRARIGPLGDVAVVGATWRMVLVAATVGAASWGVQRALESALPGGGLAGEIGRLAASVATGAVVTLAGAKILSVREGEEILRRLARRARA